MAPPPAPGELMYTVQATNIPGILDDGNLHSQANSQVWNLVFPGPLGRRHHSLRSSGAEPSRDQDSVRGAYIMPRFVEPCRITGVDSWLQGFSLNPHKIQLAITVHCGVF